MTTIDFSKMKTYKEMRVEENKKIITKLLNNFDKNGKTFNILDLYDMAYELNRRDISDYEDLDDRFDDLFERYAKETSKYFMKVFELVAVRNFFVERVDVIIPYLSFMDLEILEKKIIETKKHIEYKIGRIQDLESCNEELEICDDQLYNIKEAEKNIIKISEKLIKQKLENNDINIIDLIFDYI